MNSVEVEFYISEINRLTSILYNLQRKDAFAEIFCCYTKHNNEYNSADEQLEIITKEIKLMNLLLIEDNDAVEQQNREFKRSVKFPSPFRANKAHVSLWTADSLESLINHRNIECITIKVNENSHINVCDFDKLKVITIPSLEQFNSSICKAASELSDILIININDLIHENSHKIIDVLNNNSYRFDEFMIYGRDGINLTNEEKQIIKSIKR